MIGLVQFGKDDTSMKTISHKKEIESFNSLSCKCISEIKDSITKL